MPKFFTQAPTLDPTREIPERAEHGQGQQSTVNPEDERDPVRLLLSWTAPSRPFRQKDRSYYTTIAIIVVLLILISLLMREFILVGVLLAISFVAYVLGFIPPEDVEYKISTQGVTVGDHFYFWNHLDSFWFGEKENQTILYILTRYNFPSQLLLVLGETGQESVKKAVAKYLPFHEIAPKTLMDNWANSLQKHFPLEKPA